MRRPAALLPVLAALACRPAAGHRARQTLAPASEPAPMVACVDAALGASPLVARVLPASGRDRPRTRRVLLMAPPGPRIQGLTFAVEPPRDAPRQLAVEYTWPGASGMAPPEEPKLAALEGQAVADIAVRLLREVRARCAPTAAGEPACSMVQQSRVGRCTLGV